MANLLVTNDTNNTENKLFDFLLAAKIDLVILIANFTNFRTFLGRVIIVV